MQDLQKSSEQIMHNTILEGDAEHVAESNESDQSIAAEPDLAEPAKEAFHVIVSQPVLVGHISEMEKIIVEHQVWLDSVLNPTKKISAGRANIAGSDLSGWDLSGLNLSGASMRGCKLVGADLRRSNLTGVDLCGADLRGAKLDGARLRRAHLARADLRGASLEGCDLHLAKMEFVKKDEKTSTSETIEESSQPEVLTSEAECLINESPELKVSDEAL